jgi:hypothetical protein
MANLFKGTTNDESFLSDLLDSMDTATTRENKYNVPDI